MPLPRFIVSRSRTTPAAGSAGASLAAAAARVLAPALVLGLMATGASAQSGTSSDGTPCRPTQEDAAVVGGSDIQPTEAELAAAGCPDVSADEAKETEQLYEELMQTDDPPAQPEPESSQ